MPSRRSGAGRSGISIARQVLLLQLGLVLFLAVVGGVLGTIELQRADTRAARDKVLSVAETLARSNDVRAGVLSPDPTARLQPLASSVQHVTGVDFVVVMSTTGVRYTHPNPAQIGKHFLGHIAPAVAGRAFTETYTGTLGRSVRSVVPVRGAAGRVVALVSVGITEQKLTSIGRQQLPGLAIAAGCALLLALAGSLAVGRRLRRVTRGLGPVEITAMYEHHEAVLHALREGVVVVTAGRLSLANDEARRLLGLPDDAVGTPVRELALESSLADLLVTGREARDELHVVGDRVVALNQMPALREGHVVGVVMTLRDHTELEELTGELASLQGFAEALRAAAHEAANRLHTVVTLIELGRSADAVRFATAELAASQELTDQIFAAVGEPALAALLLGKIAGAKERGVELSLTPDSLLAEAPFDPSELVTVVGNLIDNATDAAVEAAPPRWVRVTVRVDAGELVVRVADSGPGVDLAQQDRLFQGGWSTKQPTAVHGRGLGLALVRQVARRHGGRVEVGNDGGAVFLVRLPIPATVA